MDEQDYQIQELLSEIPILLMKIELWRGTMSENKYRKELSELHDKLLELGYDAR